MGDGFIFVYSVTAPSTFYGIANMRDQLIRVKDSENVPIILVGNKCDLVDSRAVTTDQGAQLAEQFHCKFLEASACTKQNVNEIFHELVREIRKTQPPKKESKKSKKHCIII